MKYRPQIDGLRAVAVLAVILAHGGMGMFGGGFVGVDVFFVISGFLITALIMEKQGAERFSIVRFYERRIRRLVPALTVVTLCTLPFAWRWIPPEELAAASRSLIGVAGFASNLVFWRESGYFATEGAFKPFLHTWSLAVEEQFYLLFPVLLMLTARIAPNRRTSVLAITSVGSLALAQWASLRAPSAAFFLLPTRAWELGLGALLASTGGASRLDGAAHARTRQMASLLGLAMIVFAILIFDRATPVPGFPTLIPCVGAVLVLSAGNDGTVVGWLLSRPLPVLIGRLSYSAYLWHQPIFALARYRTPQAPSSRDIAMLACLALALAYVTWRFIEQPFRDMRRVTRRQIFGLAAAASLTIGALGIAGFASRGFPDRFSLPPAIVDSFRQSSRISVCFSRPKVHERADWTCDLGTTTASPAFLVTGDSYAAAFLDTFDEIARSSNVRGVFAGVSGCPPLLGVYALRRDQMERDCHRLNERVLAYVRDHGIRTIVLVARWSYYTDGSYDGSDLSPLGPTASSRRSRALSRAAFQSGVEQTFKTYAALGVHVIVLTQVPEPLYDARGTYYRIFEGDTAGARERLRLRSTSVAEHRRLQMFSRTQLERFATGMPDVQVVDLDPVYCDRERCVVGDERGSRYFDRLHLSAAGASRARPVLREALARSLEQPTQTAR